MSQQGNEQKVHKATQKKIKKQREKGKVAKSSELYSAVANIAGIIAISVLLSTEFSRLKRIFGASQQATEFEWWKGLNYAITVILYEMVLFLLPLVGAIMFAAIVSNVVYLRGIPISFDPLKPDFNRLNPGEGLKKIFGRRNAVDSLQKIVRLIIWSSVMVFILWVFLSDLLNAPICGKPCTFAVGQSLVLHIVVAVIIILLIIALFDAPIQKALFELDMKMSSTEKKREEKDEVGSPEIRSERKRLYREILSGATAQLLKLENANLVISGKDGAVAILYSRDIGIPVVSAVARGDKVMKLVSECSSYGIPVINDPELTAELITTPIGSLIPEKSFVNVAKALALYGKSH